MRCGGLITGHVPQMEERFERISGHASEVLKINDEQRICRKPRHYWSNTPCRELVRLNAHLEALRDEVRNNPHRKKMRLYLSEINREINTIGSKSRFWK